MTITVVKVICIYNVTNIQLNIYIKILIVTTQRYVPPNEFSRNLVFSRDEKKNQRLENSRNQVRELGN